MSSERNYTVFLEVSYKDGTNRVVTSVKKGDSPEAAMRKAEAEYAYRSQSNFQSVRAINAR